MTAVATALHNSRSQSTGDRIDAIEILGSNIHIPECRARIIEMLRDKNMTVEIDAAEILARHAGASGILAIFEELGARAEDPDADYLAYKLQELEESGEVPVLSIADTFPVESLTANVQTGIRGLRALLRQPRWVDP